MADSHPYISGAGNIAQMIAQLRKSFPQSVTSDTVKRLGLASKNESYVINALQFIEIIDEDGKKTEKGSSVFAHHKDEEFSNEFSKLVKSAYSALFDLHGDSSWTLESDDLITFFRQTDQTSDAIGKRQANTFKVFAAISGHGEVPSKRGSNKSSGSTLKKTTPAKKTDAEPKTKINPQSGASSSTQDIGLTVRIEINLPADGSKETYDNIFRSIKENLING
jgi:hypothetical protein